MHVPGAALLLLVLTACSPPAAPAAPAPEVEQTQETIAAVVVPAVVQVREVVQELAPPPAPPPPLPDQADVLATKLIVRWEVSSPAYYSRRLEGVICPGGASGPTWGLGWDGGHQTRHTNREAWSKHQDVDRLAETSGATGEIRCRSSRADLLDVRVPYGLAEEVFLQFGLPRYKALAVKKYGLQLLNQPAGVQAALFSETYNRGGAIRGSRGTEQAFIKDTCLPARDAECTAIQLEKMCRLWRGTENGSGLCNRRFDEARVARTDTYGV